MKDTYIHHFCRLLGNGEALTSLSFTGGYLNRASSMVNRKRAYKNGLLTASGIRIHTSLERRKLRSDVGNRGDMYHKSMLEIGSD
jgi:hypothetical protein